MFKALKNTLKIKRPRKPFRKIRLGLCAMDKKVQSKPMREILSRLPSELFEIVTFGDELILKQPVEEWPVVEVLIAFYSTRFPTEKALEYVKLRKPFLLNDLDVDHRVLKDRRKVYHLLESQGIDVPKHVILNRGDPDVKNSVEEFDEYIVVNGVQINKPLVEKPINAEDHNIFIYYPMSAGGGSKRLFRKVNDRSSEFYAHINELRTEGSYIYEEFVITQGTDVKVYTVGPDYAHAEARKSPVVDGRVKRDSDGLEIRYPVILSPTEKNMARKIVLTFKQTVCGFDILRVQGRSYCCDVNGFSFVKNSRKYYDDASQLLADTMLRAVRKDYFTSDGRMSSDLVRYMTLSRQLRESAMVASATAAEAANAQQVQSGSSRSAAGDQSSSARLSSSISAPVLMVGGDDRESSASSNSGSCKTCLSDGIAATAQASSGNSHDPPPSPSKRSDTSAEGIASAAFADNDSVLCASQADVDSSAHSDASFQLQRNQPQQSKEELRCVIAVMRHADRTPKQKIKIKIHERKYLDYFHSYAKNPRQDLKVKSRSGLLDFLTVTKDIIAEKTAAGVDAELTRQLMQVRDVLESHEISGINRKLQMKPERWADDDEVASKDTSNAKASNTAVATATTAGSAEIEAVRGAKVKKTKVASTSAAAAGNGISSRSSSSLASEILLILKWGGDLTPLGREQAEQLGEQFRQNNYPDSEGGGVLRLHATYRHDLKVKASDEGRVMKTAAAFAKGLLELEGQLTPILASLVTVEEKNSQMLDRGDNFEVKADMDKCKKRLDYLQVDEEMSEELIEKVAPGCSPEMRLSLYSLKNPLRCLQRMHELMKGITAQLKVLAEKQQEVQMHSQLVKQQLQQRASAVEANERRASVADSTEGNSGSLSLAPLSINDDDDVLPPSVEATPPSGPATVSATPLMPHRRFLISGSNDVGDQMTFSKLYLNEQCDLMYDRWQQICGDFMSKKTKMFDLTKVPDVFDMVRYDVLHNMHLKLEGIEELYRLSKAFDSCVVPQEYGTDKSEKRYIGSKMCGALLVKIKKDMHVALSNGDDENAMLYRLDHTHAEDLQINSVHRVVRTRLYFTSESHMHTLLNVLRYSGDNPPVLCEEGLKAIEGIPAVSYLSQIVLRVFQNGPISFRCELSFSPGAVTDPFDAEKSSAVAPCVLLDGNISAGHLIDHLEDAIKLGDTSHDSADTGNRGGEKQDITPKKGVEKK